jgi:uncharacterized protein (TIGR03086 family)
MDTDDALQQAVTSTEKIVAGVQSGQLERATPCTEWDVRSLLNHVLGSMQLGAALLTDSTPEHPSPPGGLPDIDLVGDEPGAAYRRAAESLLAAAGTKGALDTVHQTPLGDMPGALLGGILTLDLLVHGWDLARATGQDVAFDADLTTHVFGFAGQAIQPEMREGGLVGPVVAVDASAPVLDRLVGHMGRTP